MTSKHGQRGLELRAVERVVDWGMAIKSLDRVTRGGDSKQFSKYFDSQLRIFLGNGDPDEEYKVGSLDEAWANYKLAAQAVGADGAAVAARTATFQEFNQTNGATTAMRCLSGAVCSILTTCQDFLANGAPHKIPFEEFDAPPCRESGEKFTQGKGSSSSSGYTIDRKGKGSEKARPQRRRYVSDSEDEDDDRLASSGHLSYSPKSKYARTK